MKITIKKVDGAKVSFIFALSVSIMILAFVPFAALSFYGSGHWEGLPTQVIVTLVLLPILYFIFSYFFCRIFFGLFNLIIRKKNGFEIEVEDFQKDEIS